MVILHAQKDDALRMGECLRYDPFARRRQDVRPSKPPPISENHRETRGVVAQTDAFRETLQPLWHCPPEHHVVGLQRIPERRHHICDIPAP